MKISDVLQYIFIGICLVIVAAMSRQWDNCNESGGLFVRTLFWFECLL